MSKVLLYLLITMEAERLIKKVIADNPWLTTFSLFYRDSSNSENKEWFISDTEGISFYDLCVPEVKVILEYDGARWHPTKEQAETLNTDLMEITGLSYKDKYRKDIEKLSRAERHGYSVFVIRSDYTESEKSAIISKFLQKVKA